MTSNYAKGRHIEHVIVDFLKSNGYVATRSAGSKGAFDVIAFNGRHVRLIQAKYTSDENRSFASELKKISKIYAPECTTKELWIYVKYKGFTEIHFVSNIKNIVIPKKARIIIHE